MKKNDVNEGTLSEIRIKFTTNLRRGKISTESVKLMICT